MARLIGEIPKELTLVEEMLYTFLTRELPDYITIGFHIVIEDCFLDTVLLVPHMGVFILAVKEGSELTYESGMMTIQKPSGERRAFTLEHSAKRRNRMIEYMRKNFHISPLVYDLNCFPMLRIPDAAMLQMAPAEMDLFLFLDDFDNSRTFLLKLYKYYTASLQRSIRNKNTENEPLFFDDLDDEVVFNITSYWGKKAMERERPSKPPVVFLSYNRNNQSMAYHIQRELEKKGVFTWKAPADVPIGDDYYVHEMAAIKACEAFIILLSPSSQESNEVKIEFEAAIQNKKKIFPIKLWEFEVNEYYMTALKRIEWRILEGCDYSFLDEIVKYIKG